MNNDYAKRIAEAVIEAAAKACFDRAAQYHAQMEKLKGENDFSTAATVLPYRNEADYCKLAIRSLNRDVIIASVPNEAPAEQPEDERERFEADIRRTDPLRSTLRIFFPTWENGTYKNHEMQQRWEGWQAAKRDALTQAPQERAAVTDDEISEAILKHLAGSARRLYLNGDPVNLCAPSLITIGRALLSLSASSEGKKP